MCKCIFTSLALLLLSLPLNCCDYLRFLLIAGFLGTSLLWRRLIWESDVTVTSRASNKQVCLRFLVVGCSLRFIVQSETRVSEYHRS